MKIVVMEPLGVKMELINALAAPLQAAGHDFVYYTEKDTDQTKLLARVQQADIIMLANQPLSAEIINACHNLKMLSVAFTGVDHIALAACRERGIVVCNAAGYSTNAVAELTFGLAISVIRNIVPCDARCRWQDLRRSRHRCDWQQSGEACHCLRLQGAGLQPYSEGRAAG